WLVTCSTIFSTCCCNFLSKRYQEKSGRRYGSWHREGQPDMGADCKWEWACAVCGCVMHRGFCLAPGGDFVRCGEADPQPVEYLHRRVEGLQARYFRGLAD